MFFLQRSSCWIHFCIRLQRNKQHSEIQETNSFQDGHNAAKIAQVGQNFVELASFSAVKNETDENISLPVRTTTMATKRILGIRNHLRTPMHFARGVPAGTPHMQILFHRFCYAYLDFYCLVQWTVFAPNTASNSILPAFVVVKQKDRYLSLAN